ncbi:hypothetical protein [Maricaulis sp.]|uniref:hypothetical protein n=1 Tax=Maricaulis sp. TaxID=1486257 RepID=UPI002627471C|nr:hypothetical protein [Maricaulis sp.]
MAGDGVRALGALIVAAGLGLGAAKAAPYLPWAQTGPEQSAELVYTIINMTEDYDALARCPLDIDEARSAAEAGLARRPVKPVYSPIADGPGVLVHEVAAISAPDTASCQWTSQARYGGGVTAPVSDRHGRPYSSLARASRDIALD